MRRKSSGRRQFRDRQFQDPSVYNCDSPGIRQFLNCVSFRVAADGLEIPSAAGAVDFEKTVRIQGSGQRRRSGLFEVPLEVPLLDSFHMLPPLRFPIIIGCSPFSSYPPCEKLQAGSTAVLNIVDCCIEQFFKKYFYASSSASPCHACETERCRFSRAVIRAICVFRQYNLTMFCADNSVRK